MTDPQTNTTDNSNAKDPYALEFEGIGDNPTVSGMEKWLSEMEQTFYYQGKLPDPFTKKWDEWRAFANTLPPSEETAKYQERLDDLHNDVFESAEVNKAKIWGQNHTPRFRKGDKGSLGKK